MARKQARFILSNIKGPLVNQAVCWAEDGFGRKSWYTSKAADGESGLSFEFVVSIHGRHAATREEVVRLYPKLDAILPGKPKAKKLTTIKQALRLLTRPGRRTPEQIAAYLKKQGLLVKACEGKLCRTCPIARFFNQTLGRKNAVVDGDRVYFGYKADEAIDLPYSVTKFITLFDGRKFDSLIAA